MVPERQTGETDPSQLDPRVRRTRADVVEAAGQILLEEGWEAVTHAHVAEKAGYSRATLYRHWREQTDLVGLGLEGLDGVAHRPPTGDLAEDLVAELEALRQFLAHRGFSPVLAALAHHAADDEQARQMRDETIDRSMEVLRRLLRDAEAKGALATGLDAATAAALLVGGLTHEIVLRGRTPGPRFVERSVSALLGTRH